MNPSDFPLQNLKLLSEISKIPLSQRFFTGKGNRLLDYFCNDVCVFGYGSYPEVTPLTYIPDETKGLYLYYGSGIKDLLEEILKLKITDYLEYLAIGITHNNDKDYADYSEISKLLSNTYFPKLKFLEYGVDELLANQHCIYGNLGDITGVLSNMPKLEKLYLYGNFQLEKPLRFQLLTDLEVLMDDWGLHINGGKITNHTLQQLLLSKFDSLRLMSLNINFNDDDYDYTVSEVFLSGQSTPKLEVFELEGKFTAGTKQQISKSKFLNSSQIKLQISGIKEPSA